MKVKLMKSGETMEVSDCWGRRLIEHGMAVLCRKKTAAATQAGKGGKKAADEHGAG